MVFGISAFSRCSHVPVAVYWIAEEDNTKDAPCRCTEYKQEKDVASVYDWSDEREESEVL